jgi:hypothetical protein
MPERVGFYGLDLYSLHASIRAVLNYLEKVDPEGAPGARYRYACFDHFREDTQAYGYAASFGLTNISGGAGFADSYYMPLILGWSRDRFGARAIYGFLAPTGRFVAGGTDNVGSGYWMHALSSGQTFYLNKDKLPTFSAFEMYEFHTTQEGTQTHPGGTFDFAAHAHSAHKPQASIRPRRIRGAAANSQDRNADHSS